MTNSLQLAQLGAALAAAATPWIVVRVACGVALRHARAAKQPFATPISLRHLRQATAPAILVVGAAALLLPAPSLWMLAFDGVAFVLLGAMALGGLGDIEHASLPARRVPAVMRTATLSPRRVGQYLPWQQRLLPIVITIAGLGLLAWRLNHDLAGRRLLVPLGFALSAPVFLWLYETWIRQLVSEPFVADVADLEPWRCRLVRAVFLTELALVTLLIGAAHALLDLDWTIQGGWAAAISLTSAFAGVLGCALAVSSSLVSRRYVPAGTGRAD